MSAALPEMRSAVMIVVEAWWADAAGKVHEARARMEDKSTGGACLRLKVPVEVAARLQVQWRFEQFSGVVKYCRAEDGEFVVGMQRDGRAVASGSPAAVPQSGPVRAEAIGEGRQRREAEKAEKKEVSLDTGMPARDGNAGVALPAAEQRTLEAEERRQEARLPALEEKPRSEIDIGHREAKRGLETNHERKPMKRKWLDLTPWNHKQEDSSAGENGSNEAASGRVNGSAHGTGAGSLGPAERANLDGEAAADAGFLTDLLAMEDVYLAAGVMQPRGRGVHKVIEMLRSAHMRGMAEEMKRAAVLMALEAGGITVYEIQRDAKARQDALDAYEAEQEKQAEAQWAQKVEENGKIQADMERVQAQYTARMARNLKAIALEQTVLRNWQVLKKQELLKIAEAVDICVKPAADSAVAAQAAPVVEKAHAAAAGAESLGMTNPL